MVALRNPKSCKKARNNLCSVLDALNRWIDFFSLICRQLAGISRPSCKPEEDEQVSCADHDEAHILLDIVYIGKDGSGNICASRWLICLKDVK